jgi:hypothetical protein
MEAAPLGGLFHFNVSISVAGGLGEQCSIIATFPFPCLYGLRSVGIEHPMYNYR